MEGLRLAQIRWNDVSNGNWAQNGSLRNKMRCMNWVNLAPVRDGWQAFVNAVMNLHVL
jgi:hypothetical protein